jgi:tetratricopeptide (TPR) repeat protein
LFFVMNNQNSFDENLVKINSDYEMTETDKLEYDVVVEELRSNPNDYSALLNLAFLKQRMVDYDGALDIYLRLHEEKADDILPLQNAGSIYYDTKQYEKAEEMQLTILNDITYKWINSYRELMQIYLYHLKDKRETVKPLLEYAYENYPEAKMELTGMLAQYYEIFEVEPKRALYYYEKLLEFNPTDVAVQNKIKELKK